jgi:hypothetical protein
LFATVTGAVSCADLNASVGASGPHDFAVHLKRRSSAAPSASTASRPAFVTIASRPSVGRDNIEIFLFLSSRQADFGNSEIDDGAIAYLALQLLFLKVSESMGDHDSKIVDAGSVD